MDFRDRQAIKKLELTIDRFLSEGGPFVLSNGIHFSRMNDDIINNIKRPDLVLMPFGHAKHHFFVIVAKNYAEAWPLFCETLSARLLTIIQFIRARHGKLFNLDAFIRIINKLREDIEKEENIILTPFTYEEIK